MAPDNTSRTPLAAAASRAAERRQRAWSLNATHWMLAAAFTAVLIAFFIPSVGTKPRGRSPCKSNLRQIGLALYNYHDVYGCFPPAYVADSAGRPMHSWRVLLLPFLKQQALYDQYRFDEPWNGPHNRQLMNTAMPVYKCPADDGRAGSPESLSTSYLAVIGPNTAWPEDQPATMPSFTDGMSNTVHVVEAANSRIHWMEPRDLRLGEMAESINSKTGRGISSKHQGGANSQLGDGSGRYLTDQLDSKTLRALLTRNGGEKVPADF